MGLDRWEAIEDRLGKIEALLAKVAEAAGYEEKKEDPTKPPEVKWEGDPKGSAGYVDPAPAPSTPPAASAQTSSGSDKKPSKTAA